MKHEASVSARISLQWFFEPFLFYCSAHVTTWKGRIEKGCWSRRAIGHPSRSSSALTAVQIWKLSFYVTTSEWIVAELERQQSSRFSRFLRQRRSRRMLPFIRVRYRREKTSNESYVKLSISFVFGAGIWKNCDFGFFFVNHHHFNYSLAPIKRKFPFFMIRHQKCRRKWLFWPLTLPSNDFSIAASGVCVTKDALLGGDHTWISETHPTSKPPALICAAKRIERENYVNRRKQSWLQLFLSGRNYVIISGREASSSERWKYDKNVDRAARFICFGNAASQMITSKPSKALSWH